MFVHAKVLERAGIETDTGILNLRVIVDDIDRRGDGKPFVAKIKRER